MDFMLEMVCIVATVMLCLQLVVLGNDPSIRRSVAVIITALLLAAAAIGRSHIEGKL